MGELQNSSIDLPPSSPTTHIQNFSASLDCESDACDEVLSPCSPFSGSFDPSDCELLCSPSSNLSLNFHEDQVLDGVGVPQKTCDVICDDYVWESKSKQESAMKNDFSPSAPPPHYANIFREFFIPVK